MLTMEDLNRSVADLTQLLSLDLEPGLRASTEERLIAVLHERETVLRIQAEIDRANQDVVRYRTLCAGCRELRFAGCADCRVEASVQRVLVEVQKVLMEVRRRARDEAQCGA